MSGYCTVFGIGSHARTTTVCAVDASTGEVSARTFRGNPYGEMAERVAGFPQPSYGVYEAGCTGFVPARKLSAEGRRVVPIATSHIPTSPDDRSRKTDRRDAERLARLALSGQAVEVGGTPAASARWHVARRKKSVPEAERAPESILASARSRVEHAFHAVKDLVGLRRTRYRGISKVTNQLYAAFAVANCLPPRAARPCRGRLPARRTACACAPGSWGSSGRRPPPRRGRGGAPWPPDVGGTQRKSPDGPSRAGFSAPTREGLLPGATCSLLS